LISSVSDLPPVNSSARSVSFKTDATSSDKSTTDESPLLTPKRIGTANSLLRVPPLTRSSCVALPLLKQRLGYLWEKKMFTDVVFVVGIGQDETKIEAHRVILASASEVFQELLFLLPPFVDEDGKHVLYENGFSEQSFEVFIKAMYTNEIPICLTLAMALEVFYATKKYAVVFLEDQILEHISQLLTVSNVFEALSLSTNTVELTYLAPICWNIIEEQTSDVLEYHMDDLDAHLLARILERDQLNMAEVELFQAAVRWAANLCKAQGLKTTGKNKRQFLEPLIKHFRFTTMTFAEFTDVVVPSRILEAKEVQQIKYVFNKGTDVRILQTPYKTTPRLIPQPKAQDQASDEDLLKSNTEAKNIQSRGRDEVAKISSDSTVTAPHSSSKLSSRRGTKSSLAKSKQKVIRVGTSKN